jgi:hypothetical protein
LEIEKKHVEPLALGELQGRDAIPDFQAQFDAAELLEVGFERLAD